MFFAVILFYSLFIDKDEKKDAVDFAPAEDIRSSRIRVVDYTENTDSTVLYAEKYTYKFQFQGFSIIN
jgi:hypothetical protein